jgi:hypothetical protein
MCYISSRQPPLPLLLLLPAVPGQLLLLPPNWSQLIKHLDLTRSN